jgi:hypothetical protein
MRAEIPKPVATAIIAVLVIALIVFGYFYFTRKEFYQPSGGGTSGQGQPLRPMVPGQEGAPPGTNQGGSAAPVQPF